MTPRQLAVECHKIFNQIQMFWTSECFADSWLATPCRDYILGLLLVLKKLENEGGPSIPIEMVTAVLSVMRGRDFVIRSKSGMLLAT